MSASDNEYQESMNFARQIAAQCWCDAETSNIEMDVLIAEAFAKRLWVWINTAAQAQRNADFYRGLLDQCATFLGQDAYTADDGTVMDEPIRLKIPKVVQQMVARPCL